VGQKRDNRRKAFTKAESLKDQEVKGD